MQQALDAPHTPSARPPRPTPVTARGVFRLLAVATLISLFFVLLGPFGMGFMPLLRRAAMILPYGWTGALVGMACVRLTWRLGLWPRGYLVVGGACGLLMLPPMALVVWVGAVIANGRMPPAAALPEILWQVALICVAMSYMALGFAWRRRGDEPAQGPPRFLERLPLKLRGAELWAVEAQDHYLRLHTSKGQDLILMRLADAIDELAGIEGAQVHRSWWVARDAITAAERGDGRATLRLKDGSEVPVSRTHARTLRERRWI